MKALTTMDAGPESQLGIGGINLRDYFAAKAMQSIVQNPKFFDGSDVESSFEDVAKLTAEQSYAFADALMKEKLK